MLINAKVRFSFSDYWEDFLIDMSEFRPNKEFSDQVFGWYKGEYISILKTTSNNVG